MIIDHNISSHCYVPAPVIERKSAHMKIKDSYYFMFSDDQLLSPIMSKYGTLWEFVVGKKLFEETYFDGDLATNLEGGHRNNILEFRFPSTKSLDANLRYKLLTVGAMATIEIIRW
ncbi:MAG: hypothetical protein OXC40_02450 [Proteobacteria bacterium]|nr:hypothetical protein [Pseudomonadota bacterium]